MTRGNPLSIILQFTWPLFLGNLFQQVYNTVDTMIVGRFLGENALAAVGSTGTIMFVVIGMTNGMCTGFTVLTSQKFGEGNLHGTRRSVANGMILSAAVVVVMTVLSMCSMRKVLELINTPDEIFDDAYAYIMVICGGIVTNVGYNYFASCLRAVGNSRVPLLTLIFSACVNIFLDYVLVRDTPLGVAGAAVATVTAQALSAVICAAYIYIKSPALKPSLPMFRPDADYMKSQLRVAVPMALQFGITGSGTVIMQAAINLFGATAVAAYTASSKITSLLMQGAMSVGQTMATYAGQNFGAKEIDRIRQGVRCAILCVAVYSLAAGLISYFGLPYIIRIFFDADTDFDAILYYANQYVAICACFYIPLGVIFTFRNTMQGCGYGFLPMMGGVIELIARLICAALAMKLMIFKLACLCDGAAWMAAGVFTMAAYLFVMRDLKKKYLG